MARGLMAEMKVIAVMHLAGAQLFPEYFFR
jgi:hypothetical protein